MITVTVWEASPLDSNALLDDPDFVAMSFELRFIMVLFF